MHPVRREEAASRERVAGGSDDRLGGKRVYGGTDPWKPRLGFTIPDAAYPILLGRHGTVCRRDNGKFDEQAYKALCQRVIELADI
jgi:hypothetical protein